MPTAARGNRFFLGLTPEPGVRGKIEALRKSWGSPHHAVEPHITLKAPFVWSGSPSHWLDRARQALAKVSPFTLQLGPPDSFGSAVLFLTVPGPDVPALHRALLAGVVPPLAPDKRGHEGEGHHPHLTLAVRSFGARPEFWTRYQQEAAELATGLPAFEVCSVRVYVMRPGRYETFDDLPLGGE